MACQHSHHPCASLQPVAAGSSPILSMDCTVRPLVPAKYVGQNCCSTERRPGIAVLSRSDADGWYREISCLFTSTCHVLRCALLLFLRPSFFSPLRRQRPRPAAIGWMIAAHSVVSLHSERFLVNTWLPSHPGRPPLDRGACHPLPVALHDFF